MQRVLVILAVIVLVTASLGVGAMAANWPFWRRAWAWHAAGTGWPQALPGPHAILRGGDGAPLQFNAAGDDLAASATGANTELLLRVRGAAADGWFAPGVDAATPVDGRGLTPVLLAPLFAQLETAHPGITDQPVGAWIHAWRQDARGALTPRELLASLAGGIDAPPAPTPLNPFSVRARLASGPGMQRAALAAYEATGTADRRAAAAQILAGVAAAADGRSFTAVLQQHLWSGVAADDARLPLDRRNGHAVAHCCLLATAGDWLRLGLHQAATASEAQVIATGGRALVVAPGAAVLWVGSGPAPAGLAALANSEALSPDSADASVPTSAPTSAPASANASATGTAPATANASPSGLEMPPRSRPSG